MEKQKKRVLVIDGNYFAHRCIGGMQITNKELSLETKQEQLLFKAELFKSLIGIFETFNNDKRNLLWQVIFVSDNESWRKDIPAHKPYYIKDIADEPIGYKENRKAKKEADVVNWDIFDQIYAEFVSEISKKLIVFKNSKLEGDDQMMLISNRLSKDPDDIFEVIIFCTDGDIKQTVNNRCMLMRNIRSGVSPKGEFVISPSLFKQLYSAVDPMTAIANGINLLDMQDYENLFSISIGDPYGKVKREPGVSIIVADPHYVALIKSICGDKKDNIFPILRWKSTNGAKNMKVTETHVEKALKVLGHELNDKTCAMLLQDKEELINLLLGIVNVTGQQNIDLKNMGNHLKHNMRLNILTESNIPAQYVADFNASYAAKRPLLNEPISREQLNFVVSASSKDSANIIENSCPQEIQDILDLAQ